MAGRFRNLDPSDNHRSIGDVLRWKTGLGAPAPKLARATNSAPTPFVHNDGALLRDAARPSLTWVGHATYLVQLGGRSILTDPILSERIAVVRRNVAPGLAWDALPKIDAVVLSHNHYDHMDAPTLERLGPDVMYFVPKGLAAWFKGRGLAKVVELDWWQGSDALAGVSVTLVPAQHWSRRLFFAEDATLWGGFVIGDATRRVYHSGDTAYFSGFAQIGQRCGPIDAAMLPIGAYEPRWFMKPQHMNPEDAVNAFTDLGARRFVAMHWGTFKLTDEPLDEPPRELRRIWAERGLDPARLSVPAVGETVWLDQPR